MNPLDDTLNIGPTLPRQIPPAEEASASAGSSILETDLDLQQTVRMPGAGTLTFGRYRLQRVLGRGGMGVVWLAVDTKLERAVALKFLPDAVGLDPMALKELKEETRRGLDLAHPNIVRIYDFVDDDEGAAAISMEFVDGKSLSERRIALPHHIFTVDQIGPWIGQMCDALDYAHLQKRIVHRDLKPANLMVNSDSQVKITDFGISCSLSDTMSRLSRMQQHTGTSGTLLYMSPQQAMGDLPRPTDDIYAVGATLFELLTGKPPFYRGDITTQITGKIAPKLKDRREELKIAAKDEVPKEWEEAIAACLDKDPARRPQTAGELAQMLGVSIRSEAKPTPQVKTNSVGLRQIDLAPPITEKKEKASASPLVKWILVASLVLLLLAALGAGGISWWMNRPGEWKVDTEPPGATVTLSTPTGTRVIKSPAVLKELVPGDYRATVTKDGYEMSPVAFHLLPGQSADSGLVSLVRSTGTLTVSSDPDGVAFTVQSITNENQPKETRTTPAILDLPVGMYEVVVEYEGEKTRADVQIIRGKDFSKSFKLEKPLPPPAPVIAANTPPPAPSMPSSADAPPPESSANPPSPAGNSLPPPAPPQAQNPPQPTPPNVADNPPPAPAPNGAAMANAAAAGAGQPDPSAPPSAPVPNSNTPPPALGPNPPALAGTQPTVGEPTDGHWKLDQIFASSTYAGYSESGRRYLLYKAQQELKIGADGKVGPGTHKAIQKFQTENALQPTGQLDGPTIAAMELANQPDKSDWSPPRSSGGGSGRSSSSDRTPESEKTAARKFIERNLLNGRDMKEMFKGKR